MRTPSRTGAVQDRRSEEPTWLERRRSQRVGRSVEALNMSQFIDEAREAPALDAFNVGAVTRAPHARKSEAQADPHVDLPHAADGGWPAEEGRRQRPAVPDVI